MLVATMIVVLDMEESDASESLHDGFPDEGIASTLSDGC